MSKDTNGQDQGMLDLQNKESGEERPSNMVQTEQYIRWGVLVACVIGVSLIGWQVVTICTEVLRRPYESKVTSWLELADKYIPRVGSMGVLLVTMFFLARVAERLTFSTNHAGALRQSRAPWFPVRTLKQLAEVVKDFSQLTK